MSQQKGPFVTDMAELRRRARENMDKGAVTQNYGGDIETTIKLLNGALATEIVCVLRYKFHAANATGIASEGVKKEFTEHATEEQEHADWLIERITQLGGKPDLNPEGLTMRSASQYIEGNTLVEMIKEDLIAERIAVDHYRELVRYFGTQDPTSRLLIERILEKEEEHANDMLDLLQVHGAKEAQPGDAKSAGGPSSTKATQQNGQGAQAKH